MKCIDIEIAVARHFGYRQNIIIPNVSWGLGLNHEADLLVVSPSGYAREIEIKVSAADIRVDLLKLHHHKSPLVRQVYFAVPEKLKGNPNIPPEFGLLVVADRMFRGRHPVACTRPAKINSRARKLTPREIQHLLHLGCMRCWSLKEKLNRLQRRPEIIPEEAPSLF